MDGIILKIFNEDNLFDVNKKYMNWLNEKEFTFQHKILSVVNILSIDSFIIYVYYRA